MSDSARIDELRRRLQTDPASIAFGALAEEYRRAGRFDEAIEVCRAGLVRHPAYLSARVTLGRALIELDRLEEAETELSDVLRSAPENLAAIRALSEIHTRRRRAPSPAPLPVVPAETQREFEADFITELRQAGTAGAPQSGVPLDVPQATVPLDEAFAVTPEPAPIHPPALARLERFLDRILTLKAERSGTQA